MTTPGGDTPLPDPAFPEDRYPCLPYLEEEYGKRVRLGRGRLARSTVVFCGLARDVAPALPATRARLERAGALCADYRVVIVENDSRDETPDLLARWRRDDDRVDVLSEELGLPRLPAGRGRARMEQLAACRNRYLDRIDQRYDDADYVIVVDTDLPSGFSYQGLLSTFGYEAWHVVGSNGILELDSESAPIFYDAWAFRRPGEDAAPPFEQTNALVLRRGEPPFPVWSSFGGLAVYAREALRSGCRYGGDDCEHAVLHRRLRKRGYSEQYLNPSQIVRYAGHG
mgnify:CR=1 FL=1